MKKVRLGAGAAYSGDRIDPAVELVRRGDLDYLIFECLAERTIALAQLAKMRDPSQGYDPLLEERMRHVLPEAHETDTCIITNMGAANPQAAAKQVIHIADELEIPQLRVVAVEGDDVLKQVVESDGNVLETGEPISSYKDAIVSANAYLGIEAIIEALHEEARVIITGRVADPALFLAPLVHEFGWPSDDYKLLGQGTVVGHLLECAGQITGGYYADPVTKPVPDLAHLGFPLAEVDVNAEAIITKPPGSGGLITLDTCKEQLLYEIGDPEEYLTPDVVADFTGVTLAQVDTDVVGVTGGRGRECTGNLKVSIGYQDGFRGEGQISYAGPSAKERAQLAAEIVGERLRTVHGLESVEIAEDYIGESAAFRGANTNKKSFDVRLRVAAKTSTKEEADLIGREVEALYTNGPAGGGGALKNVEEIIGVVSTLVPRTQVSTSITVFEV